MSFNAELKLRTSHPFSSGRCCTEAFYSGMDAKTLNALCENDAGEYFRAVFYRCGYLAEPSKSSELVFRPKEDETAYLFGLFISNGFEIKKSTRKGKEILYSKNSEFIEDFLTFIGEAQLSLRYMEEKVITSMRISANRISNADTANLKRAVKAASEQCKAIKHLIDTNKLNLLSDELRECAMLRYENPDMTLEELRTLLDKSISKSGLNHRLRRIMDFAEENKTQ